MHEHTHEGEDNHNHVDEEPKVIESYKEEGPVTVETIDVVTPVVTDTTEISQEKHKRKGFTLTTPVAILFGAAIIAVGIVAYGFITRVDAPVAGVTMFKGRVINAVDYVEGSANSKVAVIEYSDPECPFCTALHPTMKQLRTEYAGKVAFVYRHFPLTQIHPHSFDESRAIACAGTIGGTKKFYEYIDALFGYNVNNKTTQLPATGKEDIARGVGLDSSLFSSCMNNKQAEDTVNASINDGVTAGVQGTPSTFVLAKNRKGYEVVSLVDGARPYEYIKAAIEEALAK